MTIRPATADDVAAVTALEQEIFGVDAWSSGSVAEELTGERRHAMVALVEEHVVGYAVTLSSGDVVDLQRIAVAPGHRRTRLAGALLDAVLAPCRADRVLLEVSADNTGALAFYATHGFEEIDRRPRYYRDGSDAVVLRATIPAREGRAS